MIDNKERIMCDITRWFKERVMQAVLDTSERYETMEISQRDGMASILAALVSLTAQIAAQTTNMPPEAAGHMFGEQVYKYRKEQEREASRTSAV